MYQVQGSRRLEAKIDDGNAYAKKRTRWNRPQLMLWADNEGTVGNSGTVKGNTYPWGKEGENFIITSDHNRSALSVDQMRLENRMRMVGGNMRSYYTGQKVTLNCSWNLLPSRSYLDGVTVGEEKTTIYSQLPYGQHQPKLPTYEEGDFKAVVQMQSPNVARIIFTNETGSNQFYDLQVSRGEELIYNSFNNSSFPLLDADGNTYFDYYRWQNESSATLTFHLAYGSIFDATTVDFDLTIPWAETQAAHLGVSEFTADGGAGGADLLKWYRNTHGPFWVYLSYDNWQNFEGNTDIWEQFSRYSDRYMMYFTSFNYSVEKRGLYDMWNVSVSLEEA